MHIQRLKNLFSHSFQLVVAAVMMLLPLLSSATVVALGVLTLQHLLCFCTFSKHLALVKARCVHLKADQ